MGNTPFHSLKSQVSTLFQSPVTSISLSGPENILILQSKDQGYIITEHITELIKKSGPTHIYSDNYLVNLNGDHWYVNNVKYNLTEKHPNLSRVNLLDPLLQQIKLRRGIGCCDKCTYKFKDGEIIYAFTTTVMIDGTLFVTNNEITSTICEKCLAKMREEKFYSS